MFAFELLPLGLITKTFGASLDYWAFSGIGKSGSLDTIAFGRLFAILCPRDDFLILMIPALTWSDGGAD